MATNHHHHQCHCHPTPPTTTTCHCTMCYTTTHYPQPPTPPPNPLIHHYHPQIHQYPPPQNHQNHNFFQSYPHQQNIQENPPPLNPTVSSLIHRISALESSLRRRKHSPQSSSLREAAARTIQTHFRAYLVQRSVTLRHLKHLAHIKSALNRLKSSVSNKPHFDPHIISRESMSLLIKLDSIQGSDPMIRDGKRSISRELIRFMELIDEMCTEKQVITVKNVRFGKNSKKSDSRVFGYQERKFLENLKNARNCINQIDERLNLEKGPSVSQIRKGDLGKSQGKSQPKAKKNVSFDENGNVYRLFKSSHDRVSSDGSDNGNDDEEVEEIGVSLKDTEVEEDESSEISENEMDPRKNLRTRVHQRIKKNQPEQEEDDGDDDEDDSFVFSAPLPAKMEY